MEPRSAERGNNLRYYFYYSSLGGLQWSHAQPNVETAAVH